MRRLRRFDTLLGCWPAECCCISVCHLWLYQLLSSPLVTPYLHPLLPLVPVTQSHQSFHSLSHNIALGPSHIFRSRVLVSICMAMAISISSLSFSPSLPSLNRQSNTSSHLRSASGAEEGDAVCSKIQKWKRRAWTGWLSSTSLRHRPSAPSILCVQNLP